MSNPNGDRLAALSMQTGSPEGVVVGTIAGYYLHLAMKRGEREAARVTLQYVREWLDLIAQTPEPGQVDRDHGLVLQNLLVKDGDEFRAPIMRLLVAVATDDHTNPNPTPAFGSR